MPDSRYRPPPGHSNRTTGPRDGGPITAVTEVKEKRHHGGASGALYEEIAVDRGKDGAETTRPPNAIPTR